MVLPSFLLFPVREQAESSDDQRRDEENHIENAASFFERNSDTHIEDEQDGQEDGKPQRKQTQNFGHLKSPGYGAA